MNFNTIFYTISHKEIFLRYLLLFLLLASSLTAKDISATYKVTFGIFGQIGLAHTALHVEEKRYEIKVHAKTTGMAKFLSGQREEWYLSSGKVDKDGILIPDFYQKTVQRYSHKDGEQILKKDTKKYIFSHDTKGLHVEHTKHRGESVSFETKKGEYYAPNDLLSLFFNFKKMLPSLEITKPLEFYAVGANKTDGRIDIKPLKKPLQAREEFGWSEGYMMRVIVNDDIFASDKGELLINLREDGICTHGVLKDVLFFGDIKGEMID
jgi:hypothetical protein